MKVSKMKVVKITEVKDEVGRAISEAGKAKEPTLVLVEDRPAAYIVGARQYEALLAERKRLRREILELDVELGMEQIRRGEYTEWDSAAALMDDIEAEIEAESRSDETARDSRFPEGRQATDAKPAKGGKARARSTGSESR
ncbi:MAG TPA: type II toxin-antitoxin system Phd/YefM family antitoxin [Chloroflexota bacterium]|jgi:PHD/YefM family antitoxin component YafN of YafNO toxin-antitoxin module